MSHLLDIIKACKEHGHIQVQYNSLIPIYFKNEADLINWANQNQLYCSYLPNSLEYSFRLRP